MNMSFVLRLPREMHLNVPRLPWFLEMPSPLHPPHPLIFCNRRPLLPTPIPFAFSISINDLGSYVLRSLCFFLGTRGSFFGVQERGGAASSSLVPRLGSEILAGGGAEEFEFEFEGSS